MKRTIVREAHRPAAAGRRDSAPSLVLHILQRLEEAPDFLLLMRDIKQYATEELDRLRSDRVLVDYKNAESVPCDAPCAAGRSCTLEYTKWALTVVCPWGHVLSRPINIEDLQQYRFALARFLACLREANGIIRDGSASGSISNGRFHSVGRLNTADRSYSVFLALGLKPETFEADVAAIARLDGAKPLILSPTFRVSSPAFQRILKWNNAALWTLADVMSPRYELRQPAPPRAEPVAVPSSPPTKSGPPPEPQSILVIDRSALTITYKGHSVELPRFRVQMLIAFAERPGKIVRREELDRLLYANAIVEPGQLTDHKGKILAAFRKQLVGKDGITRAEIDSLIETKSRVGYRLALRPDQVKIV